MLNIEIIVRIMAFACSLSIQLCQSTLSSVFLKNGHTLKLLFGKFRLDLIKVSGALFHSLFLWGRESGVRGDKVEL